MTPNLLPNACRIRHSAARLMDAANKLMNEAAANQETVSPEAQRLVDTILAEVDNDLMPVITRLDELRNKPGCAGVFRTATHQKKSA